VLEGVFALFELDTADELVALGIDQIGIGGKAKAVLRSQLLPIGLAKLQLHPQGFPTFDEKLTNGPIDLI